MAGHHPTARDPVPEGTPGWALLVDGDNIGPKALPGILDWLGERAPVTARIVFRNWKSSREAALWDDVVREHAFRVVDLRKQTRDKNGSDIALAVEAMDLHLLQGYRAFCIVAGDTDYVPLANRLRYGASHVAMVGHDVGSDAIAAAVNEYRLHADFLPPPKAAAASPSRPAASPPRAPAAPKPGRGPVAPARPAPAKPAPPSRATDPRLAKLFEAAYHEGVKRGLAPQGWVGAAAFGELLRLADKDYSRQKYGIPRRVAMSAYAGRIPDVFETRKEGNAVQVRLARPMHK